jgi:iron complex transport system substrate-binding protein
MPSRLRLLALCAGFALSLPLHAAEMPQRWVSAGGGLSEWIVALGGESKLVGVDSTSQHPASLTRLASIGYQRQLSAEGILSLRPQLLVGTEEMGPPPVLGQIKGAGVQVEMFSSAATLAALQDNLEHLGRLLGDPQRAAAQLAGYRQHLEQRQQWIAKAKAGHKAPGVIFLLGHVGAKPLVGGTDTAAGWLIEEAGGHNLATNEGYKSFSVEMLAALDPEVIVYADRALDGDAALKALLKENPVLAATQAARNNRVIALDPTLLVGGLGPRLPDSIDALSASFYPDAAQTAAAP